MSKEGRFDYEDFEKEALDKLKNGVSLEGKDGILCLQYPFLYRTVWKTKVRLTK